MQLDQQVFPHKYIKRVKKGNRWVYLYRDTNKAADLSQVKEYHMVIAHQQPTGIMVDGGGVVVYGPPQTIGKHFFINTNPAKGYEAKARNADGSGAVYLYPATSLVTNKAKKAAKFLRIQRNIGLIDKDAESLMQEPHPIDKQYGLAMWLNNNSHLRIGAHEDAASVDASERRKIINQARAEGWTDKDKEYALKTSATPTFGLLTTRIGHVTIDPKDMTASWNFRGKGGKMITANNVTVPLPPLVMHNLMELTKDKNPDDKLFPDVIYKRLWRKYKTYGATPHDARGAFADKSLRDMVASFVREKSETAKQSENRLRSEIKENISEKLGHTPDMTLRAYVSDTTRKGLDEFIENLYNTKTTKESAAVVFKKERPYGESLAELLIWLELGPGNTVL